MRLSPRAKQELRRKGERLRVPSHVERRYVAGLQAILAGLHRAAEAEAHGVIEAMAAMPRRKGRRDSEEDDELDEQEEDDAEDEGDDTDEDPELASTYAVRLAVLHAVLMRLRSQVASKAVGPYREMARAVSAANHEALVATDVIAPRPAGLPVRPPVATVPTSVVHAEARPLANPPPLPSSAKASLPGASPLANGGAEVPPMASSTEMVHVPGHATPHPLEVAARAAAEESHALVVRGGPSAVVHVPGAGPLATTEAGALANGGAIAQSPTGMVLRGGLEGRRVTGGENPNMGRATVPTIEGSAAEPVRPSDIGVAAVEEAKAHAQRDLVARAAEVYTDQVVAVLSDPDNFGLRHEEIATQIVERGDVSTSRAALIARDQTSKVSAAINQRRQLDAGVTSYRWSTSLDERVRDTHVANEGQVFDWDSPPEETGHPGDDINCRCTAVAILNYGDDSDEG